MQDNYRVLVLTSDRYLPAIGVFAYLFNKYWRPETQVVISGFRAPEFELPPNFTFHSVGDQSDFPFNRWSNALYKTLEYFRDDVFVLMLEDYWLTRPVNEHAVSILVDYARTNPDVLKIDISADRLYAAGADTHYATYHYLDLVLSKAGSPYHMSLWPGIWNSSLLLLVLAPDESPHDLEIAGSTRLSEKFPAMQVVGTRQNPVQITLGLRARDYSKVNIGDLPAEDVLFLKENHYLTYWGVQ